jgi:hypothetical protein
MAGFEHETKAEKFMPVRIIGYDGQSYRAQLLHRNVKRIYPVITLVLYFGLTHLPYSHHLIELIDMPERYKPFITDYEMKNLFKVAFMSPKPDTIKHVDATLKLMSVLTGDHRFEEVIPELPKKGGPSMCAILDKVENKGKLEGMVSVYYNDMGLSPEQIAKKLNKPLDEVLKIIDHLKQPGHFIFSKL